MPSICREVSLPLLLFSRNWMCWGSLILSEKASHLLDSKVHFLARCGSELLVEGKESFLLFYIYTWFHKLNVCSSTADSCIAIFIYPRFAADLTLTDFKHHNISQKIVWQGMRKYSPLEERFPARLH